MAHMRSWRACKALLRACLQVSGSLLQSTKSMTTPFLFSANKNQSGPFRHHLQIYFATSVFYRKAQMKKGTFRMSKTSSGFAVGRSSLSFVANHPLFYVCAVTSATTHQAWLTSIAYSSY